MQKKVQPVQIKFTDTSPNRRIGPQQIQMSAATIQGSNAHIPSIIQSSFKQIDKHVFENKNQFTGTVKLIENPFNRSLITQYVIEGDGKFKYVGQNYQYRGNIVNSKHDGQGKLLFHSINKSEIGQTPPMEKYVGSWKNGLKNDFGTYNYEQGKYYSGNWVDNQKYGKGKFVCPAYTYDGEWVKDQRHGQGQLTMKTGEKFVGMWENNYFVYGTLKYPNGDVYQGKFKNYKKNGPGVYMYSDGTVFKGEWKDDKKVSGEIIFKLGDKFKGKIDGDNHMSGQNCVYTWDHNKLKYQFTGSIKNHRFQNGRVRVFDNAGYEKTDLSYKVLNYEAVNLVK